MNHFDRLATMAQAWGNVTSASIASAYANLLLARNCTASNRPTSHEIGALATFVYIVKTHGNSGNLSSLRDGIRRMFVAGLPHEAASNDSIKRVFAVARPGRLQDKRFDILTVRDMVRLVGIAPLCLMAGSLCRIDAVQMILLDYASSGSWVQFTNEVGYDYNVHAEAIHTYLEEWAKAESNIPRLGLDELVDLAKTHWPVGPLSKAPAAQGQPTDDEDQDTSQPATTTSTTSTTGVTMSNANIAPATANIINAVLQSAGLSTNIEVLLADSEALTVTNQSIQRLSSQVDESKRVAAELQQQLDAERRKAATAMPSTVTLTSGSSTIPDGTMQMVDAATVFSELNGLHIKVPSFTWDGDHPDVPKRNDAYIFRKGMLISALRTLANGDNIWLQGHTGSGKTTFIEQVASRLGWPVARVAYDSNVDRAELVGRMQLTPDGKGGTESKWLPGILERAISGGYILLCDEMDAGHPNALYTLQPLLEGKGLTLLEDGGRVIPRHPFARIVATGNTTGNGDPSGLYPACRILSAATLDRFQDFVQVPYLTEDEETKLICSQAPGLKDSVVKTIVKFGSELRKAFVSGETPISFSPRRSVAFARHVEDLQAIGIKDEALCMSIAFRSKLYDAAPEEHRQRLFEIGRAKITGLDIDAALLEG